MKKDIYEVASYRGELMLVFYKNSVMTQFHPERTIAGKRFLQNWLYEN
jgi:imidazoleglycerol phosphate synthase glutamine amidotransferase subunit HisH